MPFAKKSQPSQEQEMQEDTQINVEKLLAELDMAISTLESHGAALGEKVVSASIEALKLRRQELLAEKTPVNQQRKFATIMMMDIAGHTQMVRDLDPEENMALIDAALMKLAEPIEEFGGRVTRFTGDGFKAIFGHPVARENEPEMAVRAGLAILERCRSLGQEVGGQKDSPNFQVRIGLDSGLVFVGGQSEGEDTVKGNPVNMAARLEQAAPPDRILISHNTYQHVHGIFTFEEQDPMEVKGFDGPVTTYLVSQVKPRAFHLPARGVEGVETKMIGRTGELEELQDALNSSSEAASSRMITVFGEAGVGKSRLMHEFENWIDLLPDEVHIFKGRSTPENQNTPYGLLRSLFSFRFEIQESDPPTVVQQKFENGCRQLLGNRSKNLMPIHFIGRLAGFEFKDSPFLQGVIEDNQQLKDRALSYLVEFFRDVSEKTTILILFEDIHWADDYTLATIDQLMVALADRPVLIVCNARPTLQDRWPYWSQGNCRSRIKLDPLNRQCSRKLVAEILKKAGQVPLVLREMIVEGAEGNPFYIEELIKMLIEEGVVIKHGEHWQINTAGLIELDIPPTLTGVLQARLDSLPPLERMILQQASVIGRVFWNTILFQINSATDGSRNQEEIEDALQALWKREMIFRHTAPSFSGTQEYFFKHSILRDVTYESVLKRLRPIYHRLVAEWLIEKCGERTEEFNSVIGEHFERAGDKEQSVRYFLKAGKSAARQYANGEALQFLTRALENVSGDNDSERFDILSARQRVYSLAGDRNAQQDDLIVLERLAGSMADPMNLGEVALHRARLASQQSDYPGIIQFSNEGIELGTAHNNPEMVATGKLLLGRALLAMGSYTDAMEKFQEARVLSKEQDLLLREAEALLNIGTIQEKLDDAEQAAESYILSLDIFRAIGDRRGEGRALNKLGNIHMLQGDHDGGQGYYEQYLQICKEIGDRWGEGIIIREMADAQLTRSNLSDAQRYFEKVLRITEDVGNRTLEIGALVGLGRISLEQSEYEKAQKYFEQSLLVARNIGNRPLEGKILSLIGRFFHVQGDFMRARNYYEQAMQIFNSLGARSSKIRQLSYLSLLAHNMGDHKGALELAKKATDLAGQLGRLGEQALATTLYGQALEGLGKLEEAAAKYANAKASYDNLGQVNLGMEPLAGQARIALASNEPETALVFAEEILAHIESNKAKQVEPSNGLETSIPGLEGTEEPLRVYFTCYQALKANRKQKAEAILAEAARLVQIQAENILDIDLRHSFLNLVAVNREIQNAFDRQAIGK